GDLMKAESEFIIAIRNLDELRMMTAGGRQQRINFFELSLHPYVCLVEDVLHPRGDFGKALEYADRSKARTLVEFLVRQDIMSKGEIPVDLLNTYKQLLQREKEVEYLLEQEESSFHGEKGTGWWSEKNSVINDLAAVIEKIREYD